MTPKGLLRLKQAASTLPELAEGSFRPVLPDSDASPEAVRRLVLCSGKVYYDLAGHELRGPAGWIAVGRSSGSPQSLIVALAAAVAAIVVLAVVPWARQTAAPARA